MTSCFVRPFQWLTRKSASDLVDVPINGMAQVTVLGYRALRLTQNGTRALVCDRARYGHCCNPRNCVVGALRCWHDSSESHSDSDCRRHRIVDRRTSQVACLRAGSPSASVLADLLVCFGIWIAHLGQLQPAPAHWFAECNLNWIPQFGIRIHLAIDGLSLTLLLLTYFFGIMAVLSSWTEIRERVGFFHFNLLWVLAGITGVFLAMDLFVFYLFWELMLVPMYFLIGIWGHERRIYAATKFFLFTQLSGLLMLIAIIALAVLHQQSTGSLHLRLRAVDRNYAVTSRGASADARLLRRLRCQTASFSLPHLASGCAHRSSHGRQRHPGGTTAEDRRIRTDSFRAAAFPGAVT